MNSKFSRILGRLAFSAASAACILSLAGGIAAPTQAYAADAKGMITINGTSTEYPDVDSISAALSDAGAATVTIDVYCDWDVANMTTPENSTVTLNLNGHVLTGRRGNTDWYAAGDNPIIRVSEGSHLYINGGDSSIPHYGTLYDTKTHDHLNTNDSDYVEKVTDSYYWRFDGGSTPLYGGLITGGSSDSRHGAGGIALVGQRAHVTIKDTTIAGNLADEFDSSYGHGAGIAAHYAYNVIDLDNSKVIYNHSEGYGGGIYLRDNHCTINMTNGSEVSHNYSDSHGGAIFNDGNDAAINIKSGSKVSNNWCQKNGGGIYNNCKDGSVNLDGGEISGNYAHVDGGGIYDYYNGTSYEFKDSAVDNNDAGEDGGGVCLNDMVSKFYLSGSSISNNSSDYGGGMFVDDNDITVELHDGSKISNNRCRQNGGGITFRDKRDSLRLYGSSEISGNRAVNGGGVYISMPTTNPNLVIQLEGNSGINNNVASNDGGAYAENKIADIRIYSDDKTGEMSGNCAAQGGAIRFYPSADSADSSYISGITFKNNSARTGGAIYWHASGGTSTLLNSTFTGNTATSLAGAIYIDAQLHVGGKNVITGNTLEQTKKSDSGETTTTVSDSNLWIQGSHVLEFEDDSLDGLLDSRIGIGASYVASETVVSFATVKLSHNFEGCYDTCFTSDNPDYKVTYETRDKSEGDILCLRKKTNAKTVTVKYGKDLTSVKTLKAEPGDTVKLSSADYGTTVETTAGKSLKLEPDYWTPGGLGTAKLTVENGTASFTMPEGNVTVIAHYPSFINGITTWIQDDSESWGDVSDADKVSVLSLAFVDSNGNKYALQDKDLDKLASVQSVKVDEGIDSGRSTKQVAYTIKVKADALKGLGIAAGSGVVTESVQNIKLTHALEIDDGGNAKVEMDEDGSFTVTLTATFYKPKEEERTLAVKQLNANDTSSDLDAYSLTFKNTDESVTISPKTLTGWKFVKWDDTPESSHVDGDNLVLDSPDEVADGSEIKALYEPLVGYVKMNLDDLTVGKSFPSKVASFQATDTSMKKATSASESIAWTRADGSAAGDTVEAGAEYRATITVTPEFATDYLCAFDAAGSVTVNDKACTFSVSEDGKSITVSYDVTAPADEYVSTITDFDDIDLVVASQYADKLPTEVKYETTYGEATADIAWETDGKGYEDVTDGTFTVTGSFVDKQGASHTVSQTFSLATLNAPGVDTAEGSYDEPQSVGILADEQWANVDGVQLYYYVMDYSKDAFPESVPLDQFVKYTGPVVIDHDSFLLAYAKVGNRQTEAQWWMYDVEQSYSVTIEDGRAFNSDDVVIGDSGAHAGDTVRIVASAAPEDKVFSAWEVVEGDVELQDSKQETTQFIMPAGDVKIKATYVDAIKYVTVNFDADGGSKVAPHVIKKGTAIGALPMSEREGYDFAGWYTSDGELVAADAVFTEDTTIKAKWNIKSYTVTYKDGDAVLDTATVNYGDKADEKKPTKDGYAFAGWYADEALTEKFDFNQPITADTVVYAKWSINTYRVSFDTDGGSAVDDQTVEHGSAAARPADPAREGYAFKGWYADEALTAKFDFSSPITADTELHAKWVKLVKVTFDADGGEASESSREVEPGEPVGKLPTAARDGYSFDGWYDGSTRATSLSAFSGDVTLTARWRSDDPSQTRWLVTFTDRGEAVDTTSVRDGSTVSAPSDPVRDGYAFAGWYADEALTEKFDFNQPITADTVVYAKWSINTYRVSFDTDGGSAVDDQTVEHGSAAARPADPAREGYAFKGWYADEALTAKFDFSSPITADTELHAKWVKLVTISFNSKAGTAVESKTVESMEPIGSLPEPTREGYVFRGWYIKGNVVTSSTMFSADAELTARWTKTNRMVTFMDGDEGYIDMKLVGYGSAVEQPADPMKTGYAFAGWYADEALTEKFDFNQPITADTVVYAKWSINTYRVSFDTDGGSAVDDQTVEHGSAAVRPADPAREGYAFKGWYADEALTEKFDFNQPITADTVVYAKWTINTYTVRFDSAGGSAVGDQVVDYGSPATQPADPTLDGFTFEGWCTEDGKTYDFSKPVTSDIVLYAHWSASGSSSVAYLVVFDTDGGSDVIAQTVGQGSKVSRPADPSRDGYAFAGWYADEDRTSEFDFDRPITADTVIYAKWEKEEEPTPEPEPSAPDNADKKGQSSKSDKTTTTTVVKTKTVLAGTGDDTALYVGALAIAGLACVAAAIVLRLKRK